MVVSRSERMARNRFGLVIGLIMATYIVGVTADNALILSITMLLQFLTLWLVFTITHRQKAQRLAAAGGGVVAVLLVVNLFVPEDPENSWITRILVIVSVGLYIVAPAAIFRHLLSRPTVDVHAMLGAVASYLLIGMMFAFLFRAITVWQGGLFFGDTGTNSMSNFLFYSFTTLTTVGYGNLVPVANPGQSAAILEAILGQLFLVTAVGKIVTAWKLPSTSGP